MKFSFSFSTCVWVQSMMGTQQGFECAKNWTKLTHSSSWDYILLYCSYAGTLAIEYINHFLKLWNMNFVYQMLKTEFVSLKTLFISITKTNQPKLFMETISLFWGSYKTRKHLCGQCAEFWQCLSKWYTKLPLFFRGVKGCK
jgi:hypothetical protein